MDSIDYLFSLERLGMKFGLEQITRLCAALGDPQHAFQSVIVAGTNGKGSVTAMVERGVRAAGHRTARYTSPHLVRLEERYVIDGREVSTEALAACGGHRARRDRTAAERGRLRRAADVLRIRHGGRVRALSRGARRTRRSRSRPRGPSRRHQRRRTDRGGDHVNRFRPSGPARRHARLDRARESGRHQARHSSRLRPAAR